MEDPLRVKGHAGECPCGVCRKATVAEFRRVLAALKPANLSYYREALLRVADKVEFLLVGIQDKGS